MAALFTRLWSPDSSVNEDYLAWRYEKNPYPGVLIAVCEHDGEIVAVRGAHGMRWRIGDSSALMPCLGDTVVDEQHEGRALVQQMTRWLLEALSRMGIDWVVNQSPGPLVEKISLRTGWRRVAEWTVAYTAKPPPNAAIGFEQFDDAAAEGGESNGLWISGGDLHPAEMAALVAQTHRGRIAHIRDAQYFEWRTGNPLARYRWLYARSDRLEGYLLLGSVRHGSRRVRILDLQGVDGGVQSLLLDRALQWGNFQEVRVWWNRFPRQVSRLLSERGFGVASDNSRRRATTLVAPTQSVVDGFLVNGVDLLKPANWDPRMIQSDAT